MTDSQTNTMSKDDMIEQIVHLLLESYDSAPELINRPQDRLPSHECVTDLTQKLENILYPGLIQCTDMSCGFTYKLGSEVNDVFCQLNDLIKECLQYGASCVSCRFARPPASPNIQEQAQNTAFAFFKSLPDIRKLLVLDLKAAYNGDPAAKCAAEILLSYPGVRALAVHRIAHCLHKLAVPVLPRMMSEYVHNRTGIDIHPAAQIGHSVFIDHGTGVVIGETAVVGNNVKIYQGVTLGALSIPDPDKNTGAKRHPTIENNVTIYSGASILGGNTIIGARSIIGSNVWLTHSVAPDTKVLFVPPDLRFKSMENIDSPYIYYI